MRQMPISKNILLISSDGKTLEVAEDAIAAQSYKIKMMIESGSVIDGVISLPEISSKTLVEVIEYCNKHAEAEKKTDEQPSLAVSIGREHKAWVHSFKEKNTEDRKNLADLLLAAVNLEMTTLLFTVIEASESLVRSIILVDNHQSVNTFDRTTIIPSPGED